MVNAAGARSSRYLGAVLTGPPKPAPRGGYSIVELFAVIVLIGLLVLIMVPRIGRGLTSSRVDRAASLIALMLERSFTLSARHRQPVVIACEGGSTSCASQTLELRALTGGNVYMRRTFGPNTEFQVDSMTLSTAEVTVRPHGVADDTLTVTISAGAARRRISLSSAGLVRVAQ